MSNRGAYRALCAAQTSLSVFHQAWWLDAVCGRDEWDVALVYKGNEIHAALPYLRRRSHGFTVLTQPALTPFLGPWIRDFGARAAHDYERQKDLMSALIDALPDYDRYTQTWDPRVTNWLPFHWRGFEQTTYYTYVLHELPNEEKLWSGLRGNVRTDVRKAEGRSQVVVTSENDLEEVLKLNALTFRRKKRAPPYSKECVARIDRACAERNCRRMFVAKGADGRPLAAVYLVWDAQSAYYLLGGLDPDLRVSGAMSLCMWRAICFAATVTKRFDFEGSMIESIERFFRGFGSVQVPYFRVSRTRSAMMRRARSLRMLFRGS